MVLVKANLFFATATSFVEQWVSDQAMSTYDVFGKIKSEFKGYQESVGVILFYPSIKAYFFVISFHFIVYFKTNCKIFFIDKWFFF